MPPRMDETSAFPPSLVDGYHKYRERAHMPHRSDYEQMAHSGQQPRVMIISCCDSRVTPEGIFVVGPGELFVVRNIANMVPPHGLKRDYDSTSAALEYAVQALRVRHIVVLGHCSCGGVKAFLHAGTSPLSAGDFIGKWMSLLEPAAEFRCVAAERAEDPQRAMEYASIRQSIVNLRTYPWIREREAQERLALHGAWFDIASGELHIMDPLNGKFDLCAGKPDAVASP